MEEGDLAFQQDRIHLYYIGRIIIIHVLGWCKKLLFQPKHFLLYPLKLYPGKFTCIFFFLKDHLSHFFILGPMNTDMLDKKVKVCTCTSQLVVHCSFAQETKWWKVEVESYKNQRVSEGMDGGGGAFDGGNGIQEKSSHLSHDPNPI